MKTAMLSLVLLTHMVVACDMFDPSPFYTYRPPDSANDGIKVGTCHDVNMDGGLLAEAVNEILKGKYAEVHSMLIYKEGMLVLEEYFQGHEYKWDAPAFHGTLVDFNMHKPHDLMSASKSFTSACVGIAIDRGYIGNIQQSIFDYLPDHQHLKTGGKEQITVEHLVTMTSGLEWREWSSSYGSLENPCIEIWVQDNDPISYILEKPLISPPGSSFNYSTGHMHLLAEIIRNASGYDLDEFSRLFLFEPLGIDTAAWVLQFSNGVIDGNSLVLTPRGMLKFGVSFLNQGIWKEKALIPASWIAKSCRPFGGNKGINIPGEPSGKLGYSYTWWTKDYSVKREKVHMYAAGGWGGQHIMVLPELNMVVVFTGGNYEGKRPPFKLLEKYIIPAIL